MRDYKELAILGWLIILGFTNGSAQTTPPHLSSGLKWEQWYFVNTVDQIEQQFNAGRRHEEMLLGLSPNSLGYLYLSTDFLSLDVPEQALYILNAERTCRGGNPFEGVEIELSRVAQIHANDMSTAGFFGHVGSDGSSPYSRIYDSFKGCIEDFTTSENIAWFSIRDFSAAVAISIYNFIYDDACCGWGHRDNCLFENMSSNNYNGLEKFGLVGFGQSYSSSGTYFVMDFFDPVPSCSFDLAIFGGSNSGGGGCDQHVSLSGTISTGAYQASQTLICDGSIPAAQNVELTAAENITLDHTFEIQEGSVLSILIENCQLSGKQKSSTNVKELPFKKGDTKPQFRIDG